MSDLWCVHVLGPDDLYAAPDLMTAWRWARRLNAWAEKANADVEDEDLVLCHANVVPWPGHADEHLRAVPKAVRGFAERFAPTHPDREGKGGER